MTERSTTIIFAIVLILSALACNLGTPAESSAQPSPNSTSTNSEVTVAGACANAFYPIVLNASWTYKSTGSPVGEYSYTETISELRADGFAITSVHDQFTRSQEWSCTPEGLQAISPGGGSSAGISSDQFQMELTATDISGVSLPAQIAVGDHWSQDSNYEGAGSIGQNPVTSQGTISYDFEALRQEDVTVPAGTFNAMIIELEMANDVQLTMQGSTSPSSSRFSMMLSWAPNIGLVRSNTAAELSSGSYAETIELQSYNIP